MKRFFLIAALFFPVPAGIAMADLPHPDTLLILYARYGKTAGVEITDKLRDLVFDLEKMREQNDALQGMIPAIIVKQQRILPGKSYSGVIICDTGDLDASQEGKFRILSAIDGETHGFVFNRALSD
jgi:hypothetical protein